MSTIVISRKRDYRICFLQKDLLYYIQSVPRGCAEPCFDDEL